MTPEPGKHLILVSSMANCGLAARRDDRNQQPDHDAMIKNGTDKVPGHGCVERPDSTLTAANPTCNNHFDVLVDFAGEESLTPEAKMADDASSLRSVQ